MATTPCPPTTPPIWSKSTSAPSASTTKAEEPYEPSARSPEFTELVMGTSTASAPESGTVVPSSSVVTCSPDCGEPPRVTVPTVQPETSVPGSATISTKSVSFPPA